MAALPRCSECGTALVTAEGKAKPAGTKTCSGSCRQARARRLKRQQKERGSKSPHAPEVRDIAAVARGEVKDLVHEVAKEELRPVVRDAMTEDVLRSIDRLVRLTPSAIDKLEEDLASSDETIRQRAYTLLLKYTMGNPSVAPAPTEQQPQGLTVIFNAPRPGDEPVVPQIEVAAEELRKCADCGEEKPASEFVSNGPKCQACFDALHAKLAARFDK